MVINLLCCSFDNALVSTSATMSFVEQYLNIILPFSIHSRTKWCCTSMCFVRACWVRFFVNDITPSLSHQITITFFSLVCPNSFMNFVIHMASLVSCVLAMYLASVVDKVIVGCICYSKKWLHLPLRTQTMWWIWYPQGHRPNPHHNIRPNLWGGNLPKRNLNCKVPCKYQKWCLTVIQCSTLGLTMCWLIVLIGYVKSSWIQNMTYIKDPTTCW